MEIPKGTTHIWTPAYQRPYVGFGVTRRAFYKKVKGAWYVFSKTGEWFESKNEPEWFATEKVEGYFVTIKRFNSPDFTPKKEEV